MKMHYSPGIKQRQKYNVGIGIFGMAVFLYLIIAGWHAYGAWSIIADVTVIMGMSWVSKKG